MQSVGLYVGERGKGRACWLAIGYLLAEERVEYIAFQDADVVNCKREMLARLVLPTLDPTVDYDFVKGYYARVSDRLHGRVTRLLLTPAAGRVRAPDRRRSLHPLPLVLPLRAVGRVRDEERPGPAHAAALRLGPRDRDAVRGAAAPRARARVPGRARPTATTTSTRRSRREDPDDRHPPHGARRGASTCSARWPRPACS